VLQLFLELFGCQPIENLCKLRTHSLASEPEVAKMMGVLTRNTLEPAKLHEEQRRVDRVRASNPHLARIVRNPAAGAAPGVFSAVPVEAPRPDPRLLWGVIGVSLTVWAAIGYLISLAA
jgi:hypothetical protein